MSERQNMSESQLQKSNKKIRSNHFLSTTQQHTHFKLLELKQSFKRTNKTVISIRRWTQEYRGGSFITTVFYK